MTIHTAKFEYDTAVSKQFHAALEEAGQCNGKFYFPGCKTQNHENTLIPVGEVKERGETDMKSIHVICPICKESNLIPADKKAVECIKCGSLLNGDRRIKERNKK